MGSRLPWSIWEFTGLSVSRLVIVKITVLLAALVKSTLDLRLAWKRLAETRRLANSCQGLSCLLLATGPSLSRIAAPKAIAFQSDGNKVVAVNHYNETELANSLIPDYYVLCDPAWFSPARLETRQQTTWKYIHENKDSISVVVSSSTPESWLPAGLNYIFVNTVSLEGWCGNTNPLFPRGYVGLTAYSALAFSQYLGFDRTFVAGLDSDSFRALVLDQDGNVALLPNHAYAERTSQLHTFRSVEEALYFYARCIADARRFDTPRIRNLQVDSVVEHFPQAVDQEMRLFLSDG